VPVNAAVREEVARREGPPGRGRLVDLMEIVMRGTKIHTSR
jgi:hypothetical protein